MLNGKLKKHAIKQFEAAQLQYEKALLQVEEKSHRLLTLRAVESEKIISRAETLFSAIANKPIEFDRSFTTYHVEFRSFQEILTQIQQESDRVNFKAGSTIGAGALTGVGVATFAPTAAMAIATTFGTASTGTAISALSGAAATNAALAWLGGGAVIAGGGGMAAGNTLLALAGPLGWTIGGAALIGGGLLARKRNGKIAQEANKKRQEIEVLIRQFAAAKVEVSHLIIETQKQLDGIDLMINQLDRSLVTSDYMKFDKSQKEIMIAIKNHVECLSQLIKMKVDL